NYALAFGASFVAGVANMVVYAGIEVPDQPARPSVRFSLPDQLASFVAPLRDVPEFRRYMLIKVPCRLGQFLPAGLSRVYRGRAVRVQHGAHQPRDVLEPDTGSVAGGADRHGAHAGPGRPLPGAGRRAGRTRAAEPAPSRCTSPRRSAGRARPGAGGPLIAVP